MGHIKFLGNGAGFTSSHNNAWFVFKNNLVLIDLSMLNLDKVMAMKPEKYENVYLYVTHMHDDHSSGVGMFLQKMFYLKGRKVYIVAPSGVLQSDIRTDLVDIKGIDSTSFELLTPEMVEERLGMVSTAINTDHAPELAGKCFGYIFYMTDGTKIVYTGDTNDFNQFKGFLKDESKTELYIDISMGYGKVHILFNDVKDELLEVAKIHDVYLMHLDNFEKAEEAIQGTPLKIAELEF